MLKIKEDLFWTGYVDWDLKVFHGYKTPFGSTYNAYLILDEHPTLIDTVKLCGKDEMIRQIREVIDPAEIRYIVSNHAEMDHSGALGALLSVAPKAEVVCAVKGVEALQQHFKQDWRFRPVKSGDTLKIGKRELTFLAMPMVHWPESMSTYSAYDRILFPNDAFGQHYASKERFVDEVESSLIFKEAAKYYANIVLPYGAQVRKALEGAETLAMDMICPSHGLIWRDKKQIGQILDAYRRWSGHQTDPDRVLIVYDTMWGSTETMALRFKTLLEKEGCSVGMMSLQEHHISDVMTEVLTSRLLLIGTPMLNNRMLPTMAGFLMYLKGLQPRNRAALTFGSYGWSKAGFKEVEQSVSDAGLTLAASGPYLQYVPGSEGLAQIDSVIPRLMEQIKSGHIEFLE